MTNIDASKQFNKNKFGSRRTAITTVNYKELKQSLKKSATDGGDMRQMTNKDAQHMIGNYVHNQKSSSPILIQRSSQNKDQQNHSCESSVIERDQSCSGSYADSDCILESANKCDQQNGNASSDNLNPEATTAQQTDSDTISQKCAMLMEAINGIGQINSLFVIDNFQEGKQENQNEDHKDGSDRLCTRLNFDYLVNESDDNSCSNRKPVVLKKSQYSNKSNHSYSQDDAVTDNQVDQEHEDERNQEMIEEKSVRPSILGKRTFSMTEAKCKPASALSNKLIGRQSFGKAGRKLLDKIQEKQIDPEEAEKLLFKARKVNKLILYGQKPLGLPQVHVKPATQFKEFNLSHKKTQNKRQRILSPTKENQVAPDVQDKYKNDIILEEADEEEEVTNTHVKRKLLFGVSPASDTEVNNLIQSLTPPGSKNLIRKCPELQPFSQIHRNGLKQAGDQDP